MIVTKNLLTHTLAHYQTPYPEENSFTNQFLTLLEHPRCFHRDHLPGHLTGSAWIVDQSLQSVLLTHHAKLNKWLQPGGHADGDENIFAVALREAEEETGLRKFTLLREAIFDIDIHTIPQRKDFPEHLHFDIRFLFQTDQQEPLLITEESHDLKWFPLHDLEKITTNQSMLRMRNKSLSLL
ncbi:MAG TPA: NUDIX hydrolase [Ohtaekwangia sp.]